MFNWNKKEKPLLGLLGSGGGLGYLAGAAGDYVGNIAVAHGTSPFISVYPWGSGFGTKYSDPSTLPAGTGRGVAFSPV